MNRTCLRLLTLALLLAVLGSGCRSAQPPGQTAQPEAPGVSEPVAAEPTPSEPAPSEPAPSEPGPSEPAPTEPAPSEPRPSEPAPSEPAPSEPAPSEPAPSEPAPSEPAPSEPAPAEPTPSQPAPGQPAPSEPAPAEPPKPGVPFTLVPVATGLQMPVGTAWPQDGSGRLFVVQQTGAIRIIQDGRLLPEPFLDLSGVISTRGWERGLLGLAFHPNYKENGFFYVNYTGQTGDSHVARYRVSDGDPNKADPDSARVLLVVKQPYDNHNGGDIKFGPDGYLYIALGDGGSANDPQNNGQNVETLLGALLRIDVDGGEPYAIPADNPFVNKAGRDEIWAYGLRNPWRFSFDRQTGDLYIADVGQNKIEEINFQPAGSPGGQNYGWAGYEGREPFKAAREVVNPVMPVAWYTHQEGGCSVTGGYVYRGQAIPELQGTYLYGDYCSGKIWGLTRKGGQWVSTLLTQVDFRISSWGEDADGEMYIVAHSGTVYRLAAP